MAERIKLGFEDFIGTVPSESIDFVTDMHHAFLHQGCKIEVKSAKSGYVVSYLLNKKTLMNYVFRKSGLLVRIYANEIRHYMDVLAQLPVGMTETIKRAGDCKRLLNPDDCNPKCSMGYDFIMDGERHQKCRNNAFMFLVDDQSKPHIKAILLHKLNHRSLV